jgi:hypothetical protein
LGKWQRRKGATFERFVVNKFKKLFPDSQRHLEFQKEQAEKGVDVFAGPFGIQCKAYKNYAPINKIVEIKDNEVIPLLVTKGDRKEPVVCMYLDDFLELIKG